MSQHPAGLIPPSALFIPSLYMSFKTLLCVFLNFFKRKTKNQKFPLTPHLLPSFFFSSRSSPAYTWPVRQDIITSSAKDTSTPLLDFPGGSDDKASVYNAGDLGLIPGLGRFPGEGNGNPLQYSCLENPMNGGAWCRLLSMGSQRVGHDWATSLSLFTPLLINPKVFPQSSCSVWYSDYSLLSEIFLTMASWPQILLLLLCFWGPISFASLSQKVTVLSSAVLSAFFSPCPLSLSVNY